LLKKKFDAQTSAEQQKIQEGNKANPPNPQPKTPPPKPNPVKAAEDRKRRALERRQRTLKQQQNKRAQTAQARSQAAANRKKARELPADKVQHLHVHKDALSSIFRGKNVYIVGKGPSLQYLTADFFEDKDSPIMCVNEAVSIVERLKPENPVIGVRQDADLKDSCIPTLPETKMFVSPQAQIYYRNVIEQTYIYMYNAFKPLKRHSITAACAIHFAKWLGAKSFTMVCFDAYHDQICGYADCIHDIAVKKRPNNNAKRFIKFAKELEGTHLKDTPHDWKRPDIPQKKMKEILDNNKYQTSVQPSSARSKDRKKRN
jgi:uncharacterized Rossmann fold enzyme